MVTNKLGVIDGADICGYTSQVLSNISFLSAEARRLPLLNVSTGLSLARDAGTPFTPSPLPLNSNPNPPRLPAIIYASPRPRAF